MVMLREAMPMDIYIGLAQTALAYRSTEVILIAPVFVGLG
jgi:hypothetical protein